MTAFTLSLQSIIVNKNLRNSTEINFVNIYTIQINEACKINLKHYIFVSSIGCVYIFQICSFGR